MKTTGGSVIVAESRRQGTATSSVQCGGLTQFFPTLESPVQLDLQPESRPRRFFVLPCSPSLPCSTHEQELRPPCLCPLTKPPAFLTITLDGRSRLPCKTPRAKNSEAGPDPEPPLLACRVFCQSQDSWPRSVWHNSCPRKTAATGRGGGRGASDEFEQQVCIVRRPDQARTGEKSNKCR